MKLAEKECGKNITNNMHTTQFYGHKVQVTTG